MKKRYEFSLYLADPLKHSFTVIVRIMAYVNKFCKAFINHHGRNAKTQPHPNMIKNGSVRLNNEDIATAEEYYFKKGTREVFHFVPKTKYEKTSTERDDILLYTGRILPSKDVSIVGMFTDVMKDLSATTFCVPILDGFSPIAYSISMNVHWNNATVKHSGIETTQRFVLKKASLKEEC